MQSADKVRGLTIEATSIIAASATEIWAVLVDFARYESWNSFVPAAHSSARAGSLLIMSVQMRRRWRVRISTRITTVEPPSRLAWKTRYPRWLLFSERTQTLTSITPNLTHYQTSETFTGLLTPLLTFLLRRDLQRGFESVAADLKKRVETLAPQIP